MPPKPAQQKETETKSGHTNFLPRCRCTNEQRRLIEQKAAQAGLTLSEYQRRMLLDGAVITPRPLVDIGLVRALDELAVQINKIGHNINQIAHVANIRMDVGQGRYEQEYQSLQSRLTRLDHLLFTLENGS